jgi:superfamily II DNA or RNA helicase
MKITRFGYIIEKKSLSEEKILEIKKDLTVKPFQLEKFRFAKDNSFSLFLENGDYISIPKYYGIEKFGVPKINKLDNFPFPKFKMKYTGDLRPNQKIIVDKMIDGFEKYKGGILVSGCGTGKTNMAIYIACHFSLKTLFVVHKEDLMEQVKDRIKKYTNIQSIGIIRRKTVDVDHPFVVGMLRSLSMIDYDDKIFRDFGMIIIDEVHHMGAKCSVNFMKKITTKYMMGMSAEHNRNDGMYSIINLYLGPILHMEEQPPNNMVLVKKIYFNTENKEKSKTFIIKTNGEPDMSSTISNIVLNKTRNKLILQILLILFEMNKKILFLSGRIKQIDMFYDYFKKKKRKHVGKYIGGMPKEKLAKSAKKRIILGTFDSAQEGLDIDGLHVVVLATPKTSIKQSIGRILRRESYDYHPLVIDIIDENIPIFCGQSNKRDRYYRKQDYQIESLKVSDYTKKNYVMYNDRNSIEEFIKRIPSKKNNYCKIDYDNIDFID